MPQPPGQSGPRTPQSIDEDVVELLRRCGEADQRAWSRVVGMYSGLVYAIARQHGLREDQCDDIAQLVFSALLRGLKSIRDAQALPAWLSQTTRRACWRVVERERKQNARAASLDGGDDDSGLVHVLRNAGTDSREAREVLLSIEDAHRVRLALDELGGRCRELLRALFVESNRPDYDLIAQRLSMPVGSIGPTRNRCISKLAELLGERSEDD
jgi:RNA polymerase sigma factor (sigma-70 family)